MLPYILIETPAIRNEKSSIQLKEKIHISFSEACFLIHMSLFVMYVCISLNKIVFKPKEKFSEMIKVYYWFMSKGGYFDAACRNLTKCRIENVGQYF